MKATSVRQPDGATTHPRTRVLATPHGMVAEHVLLGLIVLRGGEAHGYELARHFEPGQPLGGLVRLELAMLYHYLKKLAHRGWVTMARAEQPSRPPRQLCQITPAGRTAVRRWIAEPGIAGAQEWQEFLLKLYFSIYLEPSLVPLLVRGQQALVGQRHDALTTRLAVDDAGHLAGNGESKSRFCRLILHLELMRTRTFLCWLEEVAVWCDILPPGSTL